MGILRGAVSSLGCGATAGEFNGWIFRAALGARTAEATLNQTHYRVQGPDRLIILARAFEQSGFVQPKPVRHPALDATFVPGTATLTDEGRAAAEEAASWLAQCLLQGPPRSDDGAVPPPRRRRKPPGPTREAWEARDRMLAAAGRAP